MDFTPTSRQIEFRDAVRAFAEREVAPRAREMDARCEMPAEIIAGLAGVGMLGCRVPVELGGRGLDATSFALGSIELGRACSSVRGFVTVHAALVTATILRWGSVEQIRARVPRLARGEDVGCYCLTEPEAGSDAASIATRARRDGDAWVLDGVKHWITNGLRATHGIVFAQADPDARHRGIVAFLLDLSVPGITRERMPGEPLGHRAADHAVIRFNGCRVSGESLLGGEGHGFEVAMSALDDGRLGVAAGAVGVHRACLDATVAFARERRQFGKRIADFQQVQAAIADMRAELDAAELLVFRAAALRDAGERAGVESSIAKLFATEAALRAAGQAVLLHGARGYSNEYPVERYYRDIKGLQIYEGTSHIQRLVIARELLGRDSS